MYKWIYPLKKRKWLLKLKVTLDHKLLDDENDYFWFESELSLLRPKMMSPWWSLQQLSLEESIAAFRDISKNLCEFVISEGEDKRIQKWGHN